MAPRPRRALLRALAPGLAAGLAGCGGTATTPTESPTDTPTDSPTPTDTPTPSESTPSPRPAALRCGPGPLPDAPWATVDGPPTRTRYAPDGPAFEAAPGEAWRVTPTVPEDVEDYDEATFEHLVVAGDAVVVTRRTQFGPMVADPGGHAVQARDPSDGSLLWEHRVETAPGPPAVWGDRVVVPTGHRLVAVDGGEVAWTREFDADVLAAVPAGDGCYLRLAPTEYDEGTLLALAADGERAWRHSLSNGSSALAVGGDRLVLGGYDGRLSIRRLSDGRRVAGDRLPAADGEQPAVRSVLVTDCAVVVASRETLAYGLDGGRAWRDPVGNAGATDGGTLYVPVHGGQRRDLLRAVDLGTGEARWERPLDVEVSGRPVLTGSAVLQPVAEGLLALAPDGGDERWRLPTRLRDPAVGADALYGRVDDSLVAFRAGAND